ncbi:hypothetical protein [Pedobacter zeae]|uniref:Lipoprotein n=1 Tax=Pedobacter zeae TaxID=1737356 RepID=A0A7W6KBT8_9SPHI|nr:hypothetical protein [Pedobacter zeae]MBB4107717.1 hypothetical protein [Pedobacter zeae]GGG97519.1 hypothetical protein GCM10007422_09350 [Pedobacter zeae]
MRQLLIGLMVFVVALGASCKKEEVKLDEKVKAKTEIQKDLKAPAKPNVLAVEDPGDGGIGGYPGGANTYPHNTGICYCGKYPVCHPVNPGEPPMDNPPR